MKYIKRVLLIIVVFLIISNMAYISAVASTVMEEPQKNKLQDDKNASKIYPIKAVLESARTTQRPPDADDVAYWLHPSDSSKSLVIGTQKKAGYSIYDTQGTTLADVKPGNIRFNNVDVIYNFDINGEKIDIAVITDRAKDKFVIYKIIESDPYLINITDQNAPALFGGAKGKDTAYGSAVYKNPNNGRVYAYATQNDTCNVGQFEFLINEDKVSWKNVRNIVLTGGDYDQHAEGMVVDQEYGILYIGQEEVGIYRTSAELDGPTELSEEHMIAKEGDYNLREDIEGITMYYKGDGDGYLIVSSQGNNTFAVFDRITNKYILGFTIVGNNNGLDGCEDTDSLDVLNVPFGDIFDKGILVLQDGEDRTDGFTGIGTNFKWVKWDDIAEVTGLDVDIDYNPREAKARN